MKALLDKIDQKQVVEAIKSAESQTTGEIKIHIEATSPLSSIDRRAEEVFEYLALRKTVHRNGVLIYIAFQDRKLAIFGDEGINAVVPDGFWNSTLDIIRQHFRMDNFTEGLMAGVKEAGEQLKYYFPLRGGHGGNEITDEISLGDV